MGLQAFVWVTSAWGHRSSPPQWKYVESLSGIQLDYGFDSWNRLTGMVWSKGGATLDGQQRSLDLGNRVIARQRAMDATGEVFSHDGHHRMTAWWQGVPGALSWTGASDPATWTEVERYTLDAVLARQQTERQSFGGSPVATAYAQNAAHFTTQVGAESRTVHEGFLNGDGTFYYRWDAWGRLTEVREAATGLVRRAHLYDAEGRRVLETEVEGGASKTTRYVFWGRGLAASYDLAGGNTRTYGFVGGADGEAFVRVQQGGGDDLFELARDFQGSVLALIQRTNPTSVGVVERYRYEPFGKVAIEDGSGQPLAASAFGNERFFLGRIWDEQIGIYDVRARWYEPDVGGFLSPDPLGAIDSWNRYQYGLATPGGLFDPDGEKIYGIDGSMSRSRLGQTPCCRHCGRFKGFYQRSFVYRMVADYCGPSSYYSGPNLLGTNTMAIAMAVLAEIRKDHEENPDEPIIIVGHSRGGHVALEVAKQLAELEIEVDFVGVYDPVDMTMFFGTDEHLPTGEYIEAGAVAWSDPSTESRTGWNRVDADRGKEIPGWKQEEYETTHGGLGGDVSEKPRVYSASHEKSQSEAAYGFMIDQATLAGARFRGT